MTTNLSKRILASHWSIVFSKLNPDPHGSIFRISACFPCFMNFVVNPAWVYKKVAAVWYIIILRLSQGRLRTTRIRSFVISVTLFRFGVKLVPLYSEFSIIRHQTLVDFWIFHGPKCQFDLINQSQSNDSPLITRIFYCRINENLLYHVMVNTRIYVELMVHCPRLVYSKTSIVRPSIIRHPHSTAESCRSQNFTT